MKKRGKKYFLVVVSLLFCFSIIGFLSYLNFSPTGFAIYELYGNGTAGNDTYLRNGVFANSNFGSSNTLKVGKTVSDELHPLLLFDVSSIDSSETITSAIVNISVFNVNSNDNISVYVHRVTESWIESESTWNDRYSGASWSTAGGTYSSDIEDIFEIGETGNYSFDVTNLVKGWVNSSYENNGFILISDNTSGEFKDFYSFDESTNDNLRPVLFVETSANIAPSIDSISSSSNLTNKVNASGYINFSVSFSDEDSTKFSAFFCSNSSVDVLGCKSSTFCSVINSTSYFISCQYLTSESDSSNFTFWVSVCDDVGNCSSSESNMTYVNHFPFAQISDPNGGETVNQSLGNYDITFLASDPDNDSLSADIYYSSTAGSRTNLIVSGFVLNSSSCSSDNFYQNQTCVYSWNSTNIYSDSYLDIIVNDSWARGSDSSDDSFFIRSLLDLDPANVTDVTFTSNLSSGEIVMVYANITEPHLSAVWLVVNDTSNNQYTYFMQNWSGITFNTTFMAREAGNWSLKVFANDTPNNIGNSSVHFFNVSKPNATVSSDLYPSSASPGAVISVKGNLNATDLLIGVNGTLSSNGDFSFLSDTPSSLELGNFSEFQNRTITWFVAAPYSEANYSLNISYYDEFFNNWSGENFYIDVTSSTSSSGTFIDINAAPETLAGSPFSSEILIKDANGNYVDADSLKISLQDSSGNFVVENVTYSNKLDTGHYNYTYTTSAAQPQGTWLILAIATKDSEDFYDRQYFKLTGGPFDVRDIVLNDVSVPDLDIGVTLENTGDLGQDMTVIWNLTVEANDSVLDYGSDTVLVPASSTVAYTANPSTTFVGDVKITFMGYYSGTEKAGAFETFTTTDNETTTTTTAPSGGGGSSGGGDGGTTVSTAPVSEVRADNISLDILYDLKDVKLLSNETVNLTLGLKNVGDSSLSDLRLILENNFFDFEILPARIFLSEGGSGEFVLKISPDISDDSKKKTIDYSVLSQDSVLFNGSFSVEIVSVFDVLEDEHDLLLDKYKDIEYTISKADENKYDLAPLGFKLDVAKTHLDDAKNAIKDKDYKLSVGYLDKSKSSLTDLEELLSSMGLKILDKKWWSFFADYFFHMLIVIFGILILIILYWIYKKISLTRVLELDTKHAEKELTGSDVSKRIEELKKRLGKE